MSNSIEISNLKFAYGNTPVLDMSDLEIKSGEMTFLYGPSGSGKSTLLELLAGVLKLQSGSIISCGADLAKLSSGELDIFRAKNIGYIFQSFNLVPYLSVQENILLPFLFQDEEYSADYLKHLVDSLGLSTFLNRAVSQLSVGQQQRVAVARALIKKPKIILADEPTSALDYAHREKFLKVLFDLCRENKITVLFVSHDLSLAKQFDRAIELPTVNKVKPQYEQ